MHTATSHYFSNRPIYRKPRISSTDRHLNRTGKNQLKYPIAVPLHETLPFKNTSFN